MAEVMKPKYRRISLSRPTLWTFGLLFFLVLAVDAKVVVVRPGETLAQIAAREYGSVDLWRTIARANNISDPRRLRAGDRIEIPDLNDPASQALPGDAAPPHLSGVPSVRPITGAVRYRSSDRAPWVTLNTSVELGIAGWLMTSSTGRAEIMLGGDRLEVGPFSIWQVTRLSAGPPAMQARLHVGSVFVEADRGRYEVILEGNQARVLFTEDAAVEILNSDTTVPEVRVYRGMAAVVTADGRRFEVGAGEAFRMGRNGAAKRAMEGSIAAEAPGEVVTEEDVLFRWNSVPGATGYRFELQTKGSESPQIVETVGQNSILVKKIPFGEYTWRVYPRGVARAVPSPNFNISVLPGKPSLRVTATPLFEGTHWRVVGTTEPDAYVTIGTETIRADEKGAFDFQLPLQNEMLIIGVESRMHPSAAPARSAVALYRPPSDNVVRASGLTSEGNVRVEGYELPGSIPLGDGMNRLTWKWTSNGELLAEGRVAIMLDRTPPEILAVNTPKKEVRSGEEVIFRVTAQDATTGLAPSSSARLRVIGPGGFDTTVVSEELTAENEYVFRFTTPKNLADGRLQVARVEIEDQEGNATILNSEGIVAENVDPQGRVRKFFTNLLFLGLGILIRTI